MARTTRSRVSALRSCLGSRPLEGMAEPEPRGNQSVNPDFACPTCPQMPETGSLRVLVPHVTYRAASYSRRRRPRGRPPRHSRLPEPQIQNSGARRARSTSSPSTDKPWCSSSASPPGRPPRTCPGCHPTAQEAQDRESGPFLPLKTQSHRPAGEVRHGRNCPLAARRARGRADPQCVPGPSRLRTPERPSRPRHPPDSAPRKPHRLLTQAETSHPG